jgi:hypothetical protein
VNTHFDPEDGGSMYLRNISSTAYFYLLQHPASGLTTEVMRILKLYDLAARSANSKLK